MAPKNQKKKTETIEKDNKEVVSGQQIVNDETPAPVKKTATRPVKSSFVVNPGMEVEVASNKAGLLIYVSKKTSEKFEWNTIGDPNWMTVEELATMRNTQRSFFENNWVKIEGEHSEDILRHLRLSKYYEKFIDLSDLEEIVDMERSDIMELVAPMNKEIKDNLASGAKGMIEEGSLTDLSKIRALEKAIGYGLLDND